MLRLSSIRSIELDAPVDSDSGQTTGDLIAAPKSQSQFIFDQEQARVRAISLLQEKITDPETRLILQMRTNNGKLREIAAQSSLSLKSPQGIANRFVEGTLALKAIIGIESGRFPHENDKELLMDYFGLYGKSKVFPGHLAFEYSMDTQTLRAEIERLLAKVGEEDLDRVVDQLRVHRR